MPASEAEKKAFESMAEVIGVSQDDLYRIFVTGCSIISSAKHALEERNLPEDTPVHVAIIIGDIDDFDDSPAELKVIN